MTSKEESLTPDESVWKNEWGATIRQPCTMPDHILKGLVEACVEAFRNVEDLQKEGPDLVKRIKIDADKLWGGYWHVIVGRNFGCHATHQGRHFAFFYVGEVAFMAFKT